MKIIDVRATPVFEHGARDEFHDEQRGGRRAYLPLW